MEIIKDQLPNPPPNSYCSVDLEIFGLNPKQIHRPTSGKFAAMTICYEPDKVYLGTDEGQISNYLGAIKDCIWLMHHAKFDLTHLRRWADVPQRNKLIDTLLIERILWNGYYDRFGLDHLARRYLDIYLDKSLQSKFEDATELTDVFIDYAVMDASITLQVWQEQKKLLTNTDMKVYKEIDLPALWAIMDFQGIRIDVDRWRELATFHRKKQQESDDKLPFNIRSYKKAKEYLQSKGFKGLENVQEETLLEQIRKHPETEAAKLATIALESKNYGTLSSKYGMNFIDNYAEQEDDIWVIICNYNVTGAETGRMSASDPPLHGIPVRDTTVFRECFIARPGNKFAKIDWSQQEVGIAAYHSGDKLLKQIFNSGQDVFVQCAKIMFDKTIEKSDPFRDRMKTIIHGADYGMEASGLARKENISIDEAEEMLNKFRKYFPTHARYIEHQKRNKKFVTTAFGRKAWLNPYSSQCERNALNDPIQGGGADMLKKSFATLHQEWNLDYPYPVVEVTHDEIGIDVPEGLVDKASQLTRDIMIQTANEMYPGMNFRADITIGDSWAGGQNGTM